MLGAIMSVQAARFVDGPKDPQEKERTRGAAATYRPYQTQDHWLIVAVLNDNLFRKLCTAIGRPELGDEPRFASHARRVAHEEELTNIIGATLQQQPTAVWLERLRAAGVPCSPIQPLAALFDDPQIQANGLVAEVEHPHIGTLQTYGLATKFSTLPALLPTGLGEHTEHSQEQAGARTSRRCGNRECRVIPASCMTTPQSANGALVHLSQMLQMKNLRIMLNVSSKM
jgi:crotonobetainyl-CoA:carnitine CoA-transferase CaiB-like acyl-CoA transferase